MQQHTFEGYLASRPKFDGAAIDQERDGCRLTDQILRVYNVMKSGEWMTVARIAEITGDPEPSVSAQYRNLRKAKFGSHVIEKRYVGNGLFEFRMALDDAGNPKRQPCNA